ncbi:MAG: hypothetical protein KDC10_14850, partial [Calditrichaeota bacterium]|nr:hypothetical protein [Calditrichota bacterium]
MNLNHRPATGRTLLGALTLLAFCSSTGFAMTADELAREKQHQLQLSQLDALDMQALQSADDGIRISDPIMERLMDSGLSGEALKQAYQTEWDLQRILADEAARMTQTVS